MSGGKQRFMNTPSACSVSQTACVVCLDEESPYDVNVCLAHNTPDTPVAHKMCWDCYQSWSSAPGAACHMCRGPLLPHSAVSQNFKNQINRMDFSQQSGPDKTRWYPNGLKYYGALTGGVPSGFGILKRRGQTVYEGDWLAVENRPGIPCREFQSGPNVSHVGVPHGFGTMNNSQSKWTYKGEWVNGQRSGRGREWHPDGDSYEGGYLKDKRHGHGMEMYIKDGQTRYQYDGNFANNFKHGQGRLQWLGGAVYEGEFKDGKREGYGIYTFGDGGCKYDGGFLQNRFHGQGKMNFSDGTMHEGAWARGKRNGPGKFTYADGSWTAGEWVDDVQQGIIAEGGWREPGFLSPEETTDEWVQDM